MIQHTGGYTRIAQEDARASTKGGAILIAHALVLWTKITERTNDDEGLATAEMIGYSALAIAAIVAFFALLTPLGEQVVGWIQSEIGV